MSEIQNTEKKSLPIKVKMTDNVEGKEATCEVSFGECTMVMKGDAQMITDCTSGLCYVFDIQVNEDAYDKEFDFIGSIPLDRNGNLPVGTVKVYRVPSEKYGRMITQMYLQVGAKSMNYGSDCFQAASEVAFGLSQLLNLRQKDKQGRHFTGPISMDT